MSYFNLKKLRKHGYKQSESCENCISAKKRLGINIVYVNWCKEHNSQINHVFVCNDFKNNTKG